MAHLRRDILAMGVIDRCRAAMADEFDRALSYAEALPFSIGRHVLISIIDSLRIH